MREFDNDKHTHTHAQHTDVCLCVCVSVKKIIKKTVGNFQNKQKNYTKLN